MKLLLSSRTKYQAGHLVRMCAYTVVVTSLLLIYTLKSLFQTSVLAARSLTHSIVHSSASWIGVRACVCLQVDRLHGFLLLGHHLFMAHNLCNLRKKKKTFLLSPRWWPTAISYQCRQFVVAVWRGGEEVVSRRTKALWLIYLSPAICSLGVESVSNRDEQQFKKNIYAAWLDQEERTCVCDKKPYPTNNHTHIQIRNYGRIWIAAAQCR